jgi:hypothetical protein
MIEKFIEYTGTDGNKCRVYLYSRVAVSHAEKTYVGTAVKIDEAIATIHLDAGQQFRVTKAQLEQGNVRMIPVHVYVRENEISRQKLAESLYSDNTKHPLLDASGQRVSTRVDDSTGGILFRIINFYLFGNELKEPEFKTTSNNHVPAFIAYDKTATEPGGVQTLWLNVKMCGRLNRLVSVVAKLCINLYQLQNITSGEEFSRTNGNDATFKMLARKAMMWYKLRVNVGFEEAIPAVPKEGRVGSYVLMSGYDKSGAKVFTLEKLRFSAVDDYIENIGKQRAADTIVVLKSTDENMHNLQDFGVQMQISEFDASRILRTAIAEKNVLFSKTQHGEGFVLNHGHLDLEQEPERVEVDRTKLTRGDEKGIEARVLEGRIRTYTRQLEQEYPGSLPQVFGISKNTKVLFSLTKTDKSRFMSEFVTDKTDFGEIAWVMYGRMYSEIKEGVTKSANYAITINDGFERHVLLMAFKHSSGIPYFSTPTKQALPLRMALYGQVAQNLEKTFGAFVEHLGFLPAQARF